MSAIPSAEAVIERLRMGLAEAGYTEVRFIPDGHDCDGWPRIRWSNWVTVPEAVRWTAMKLAYEGIMSCWACWSDENPSASPDCFDGSCRHPEGPAIPPRELLRAS